MKIDCRITDACAWIADPGFVYAAQSRYGKQNNYRGRLDPRLMSL